MNYQQEYEAEKHRADSFEKEVNRLKEFEQAIIDASVINWTYKKEHETNPKLAIEDLITCIAREALDPVLNTDLFTKEELASLYKFLEKQYLPYDDLFLHETVRKLGRLVDGPR